MLYEVKEKETPTHLKAQRDVRQKSLLKIDMGWRALVRGLCSIGNEED